jgi:anti-sigma factor ChrR (cupin superfamily)
MTLVRNDLYAAFMLDHAAGTLAPAQALAGDLHVLLSAAGAEAGFIWEAAGAALRAERGRHTEGRQVRKHRASALDVLDQAETAAHWRKGALGIAAATVGVPGGRLMRLEPGETVPAHGHASLEATVVIQGGLRDEVGYYETGDLMLAGPGLSHRPAATGDVPCICYVALPRNSLLRLI